MAFCINCGSEIHDRAAICPSCGVAQKDYGKFGWGLLGCCIPLVGLILFLIWKDQKPKTAKAVGIGALVGVGIWIACYLIFFVVGIGAAVAKGVLDAIADGAAAGLAAEMTENPGCIHLFD